MEMLENLSPDVLIYVQNVRKYFTKNEETREYFGIDTHGEEFFEKVVELSQKNFEETGEPELSVEQFEEVKTESSKDEVMKGVFMYLGKSGLISLN